MLVALDRVWDDLRGQNDARRGQFVHRMEALEGAEDRGEGWWRWARQSWLWDDYLRSVFFPR